MHFLRFIKFRFFIATYFSPFLIGVVITVSMTSLFCYVFVDFPLIEEIAIYRKILRPFLKAVSLLIFPPFYLVLSVGGLLWTRFFSKKKKRSLSFFEIATTQCLSIAFVRVFKVIVGRSRPENYLANNLTGFKLFSSSHHFHSFPSGHTMAAFTLAASLGLLFPRIRVLSLSIAFIFSFSRVLLLNHFPSDLFATAGIGILIAQMVHIMLNKITDKNFQKDAYERIITTRNYRGS